MRAVLTVAILVGLSSIAQAVPAEDASARRSLIAVTGEAEVRVAPDEFVLLLGIETRGLDLQATTRANDSAVARVMGVAKEAGVEEKLVQTGYMNVQPIYDEQRAQARPLTLIGYVVERSVAVTLKDVRTLSDVRAAAVAAGANRLYALQMKTSEVRKHRDQARLMAVRAAREKAVAIATELGRKVGRAFHVEVDPDKPYSSYWASNVAQNVQNSMVSAAEGDAGSDDFAPGQISVSARVKVEFELE